VKLSTCSTVFPSTMMSDGWPFVQEPMFWSLVYLRK